MATIRRTIEVPRPLTQVFDYLSDFTTTNEWDPGTVGAMDRAVPGASVADLRRAVLDALAGGADVTSAPLPQSLVVAAASRRDRHLVPGR